MPRTSHGSKVILDLNGFEITCEVASDPQSQILGLSEHASLEPNEGMLFVWGHPGTHTFWMSDVPFAIDIIGLDSQSRVSRIIKNAEPGSTERWRFPRTSAVLEVVAGLCNYVGLGAGDVIRLAADTADTADMPRQADGFNEDNDESEGGINDQMIHNREEESDVAEQYRGNETPAEQYESSTFLSEPGDDYHNYPIDNIADQSWEPDIDSPVTRHGHVTRHGSAKRAQIEDEQKFVERASDTLFDRMSDLNWMDDHLNGGATKRAVVDRRTLAKLLSVSGSDTENTKYIMQAAGSDQGLQLIGDAAVLAGVADFARLGFSDRQPILVLYKSTGGVETGEAGVSSSDSGSKSFAGDQV